MKRFLSFVLAFFCCVLCFAKPDYPLLPKVGEMLSDLLELGALDGDTTNIVYRTELDTASYESIPCWIVKIPVKIQRFHANVVLLKHVPKLPITALSTFEDIALSFSDVNTEADLRELLEILESSFGSSQQSDKFPGVLNYKWNLEDVTLSLSWTERTNAYLMVVPKFN